MVSIIIPAYNCEAYVDECVRSILNQEITSIEVIVVDDGSNDRTPNILDDLAKEDCRVKVFHVENGGPSRARNIGLDNAIGAWILFIDADDWVDRDILAKLNLNAETAPDITFFGFKRCFDDGGIETCIPSETERIDNADEIPNHLGALLSSKEEFFGYSCNKIYKSSIIKKNKIRFQEGLHVREDELFALNYCLHIQSIQILGFAPYNYRIIESSLSHDSRIPFRNYRYLAHQECRIIELMKDSCFKSLFIGKVFSYYIDSIIECVRLNRGETKKVIEEAISFYDRYHIVEIPIWQKCVFGMSVKSVKQIIIYIIFKIRNLLKSM